MILRNHRPHRRYDIGVALKNEGETTLGQLIVDLDDLIQLLERAVDRHIGLVVSGGSASVIGTSAQKRAGTEPRQEAAFDWLEGVRMELDRLLSETRR